MNNKNSLIYAPMSPGDFFDRLTILRVKKRLIKNPLKRRFAALEERELLKIAREYMKKNKGLSKDLNDKLSQLSTIHAQAWTVIDKHERLIKQGRRYAALGRQAKSMFLLNKSRIRLKNDIDILFGSKFREVKNYELT